MVNILASNFSMVYDISSYLETPLEPKKDFFA